MSCAHWQFYALFTLWLAARHSRCAHAPENCLTTFGKWKPDTTTINHLARTQTQNKLPLANKSNRLVSSGVGFACLEWNGDGDTCARPSTCSRAHVTLALTHTLSRSQTGKLAGRRRLHLTRCHVAVVAAPTCLRPELDAWKIFFDCQLPTANWLATNQIQMRLQLVVEHRATVWSFLKHPHRSVKYILYNGSMHKQNWKQNRLWEWYSGSKDKCNPSWRIDRSTLRLLINAENIEYFFKEILFQTSNRLGRLKSEHFFFYN